MALGLTFWAVMMDRITVIGSCTPVLTQAIVCSTLALLVLAVAWFRMRWVARSFSLMLVFLAAWTLFDAAVWLARS